MSGETLQDYFKRLLENIKEGKQVDMAVQEQHFKNGNEETLSPIAEHRYFMYMKRFMIHRHQNYPPFSRYT
jgi:hypothetical protein